MRARKYQSEKRISSRELNRLCEYLFMDTLDANSKISETQIQLFDETLNSEQFKIWCLLKYPTESYERIEFNNACELIKHLFAFSTTVIDDQLANRILNSLQYLIKTDFFSAEKQEAIKQVLESNIVNLKKIKKLQTFVLCKKPEPYDEHKEDEIEEQDDDYKPTYNPYDNFSWGGLTGEEAFIAYWNCQ